jgi:hypothetical protein
VRDAEPREKTYKLFDTGGLFVMVNPDGSRWWRLKYKYGEKERGISLGTYPVVSLKLARQRRDDAKRMLQDGLDPSHQRQVQRVSQTVTFELVAQEWLELQSRKLGPVTIYKARWILTKFVYPHLGSRPISQIKAPDLLAVLRKIEARGTNETAHRTKQRVGQILRYAIATGRAERDCSVDLRGALAPIVTKNHAAITEPARIAELMVAIDGYVGHTCGAEVVAAGVRQAGRAAARGVERDRSGECRVAYPRSEDEDADAAYRAARNTGCGDSA